MASSTDVFLAFSSGKVDRSVPGTLNATLKRDSP